MLSLSDAIRLESNNPAVNSFKPWWEVAVDYTLNGFLLVVLFALAGVTISGTPGLVCIPTDSSYSPFNFAMTGYLNAKCTTHVDGHVLIVFPYIIFIEWLVLFVTHLSWFHLPVLKAFLSSTFDTFTVFKEVEDSVPRTKKKIKKLEMKMGQDESSKKDGLLGNNVKSSDDDEDDPTSVTGRNAKLAHLVNWLQYFLQFKYNLVYAYAAKSLGICALTTIFAISIISWLVSYRWRTAFICDLRDGDLPSPYNHNECSFSAAPYVYSIMILNVVFVALLFFFNIRALFWLGRFRYRFSRYLKTWIASKDNHPLQDKQGFYDYYFCMNLFKENSSEGLVVCRAMESAFKAFDDKIPEATTTSDLPLAVPKDPEYSKHQFISTEILRELGMVHKISIGGHDNLWAALANSIDVSAPALASTDLAKAQQGVRGKVVQVLLDKHMFFKDLINKDDLCPVFEEYLEQIKNNDIRENGIIEDHYILMAFAMLYKLNIVVIRASKSSLLYEPENPAEHQSVRYMTFVPPRYYYATAADPEAPPEKNNAGLNFVTDQEIQTDLIKKVDELWDFKGYDAYKRTLENILPQDLPYKSAQVTYKGHGEPEIEGGLRMRFKKPKDSKKVEPYLLLDTV